MSTHALTVSQAQIQRNRRALLNDPAKFYGQGGNWISRFIDKILMLIS